MEHIAITCYRNTRRRDYNGFLLPDGFLFGTCGNALYATNGNNDNGHMLIYIRSCNGWKSFHVRIRENAIAQTVWHKYGAFIIRKNAAYTGSAKEQTDIRRETERPHGKHLDMRMSRPYDKTAIDSDWQAWRACNRERRQGL